VKVVASGVLVVVSAATLAAVMARRSPRHGRDARYFRLFARCLRWGVTTGAVTGAVIGALIVLVGALGGGHSASLPALTAAAVLYGALLGALISVLPSLLGAFVVTGLLPRHPYPSLEEAVQSDLRAVFRSVVALLDATLLAGIIASEASPSTVLDTLPLILVGNVCVIVMLRRAGKSIGRIVVATTG